MELSNGWLTVVGLLWAAEEPGFLASLGGKVWVWGAVALGVGMVIFVHELGHFVAAKMFGVKVEKFYVGFDVPINLFGIRLPRTFGKFRWGETEYGIGVIPLGGYVKMLGQDDDPRQAAAERERIRLANANAEEEPSEGPAVTLDPRSYPAKTVWQRMIIISAGVVMNLITSVLFAAIAFGYGVSYQPAMIGQTIPGYPAWEAGLKPGGQIISAGGIENDPKLHFFDMIGEIVKASLDKPTAPVSVTVRYGDEAEKYELMTRESSEEPKRRLVGIGGPIAAKLNDSLTAQPNSSAAKVLNAEHRGSDIVAIDGQSLALNPIVGMPLSDEVYRVLIAKRDQPITLTLRKQDADQQVTIAPQLLKGVGVTFSPGAIAGLVKGGPAEQAGVAVGDRIIGFGADAAEVDAIALPGLVFSAEGTVQLRLKRGEGEEATTLDVSITPTEAIYPASPLSSSSGQIELASLGLSYRPEAIVVTANPELSSLQSGDRIKRITVELDGKEMRTAFTDSLPNGDKLLEKLGKGWELNEQNNLVALIEVLQVLPLGSKVDLKALRGPEQTVVEATATISESEQFWYERGLQLSPVTLIHQADSIGDAFALGFRESKRKLGEVFSFLRMLVTGRVGAGNIGGPGAIVTMAGAAATVGITKLLLFLTFLSVNLAVLNFLPIPALDGGHMVFLIAEAVRGKPVDEELQAKLTMAGVLALLSLMAFVIINDVVNISRMF